MLKYEDIPKKDRSNIEKRLNRSRSILESIPVYGNTPLSHLVARVNEISKDYDVSVENAFFRQKYYEGDPELFLEIYRPETDTEYKQRVVKAYKDKLAKKKSEEEAERNWYESMKKNQHKFQELKAKFENDTK